jgi:hypothetical protein
MSLDFGGINYWAVLVAAVGSFLVGGLWYGVLFAKPWVELQRFDEQELKQMERNQPRNFGIFFVGDLVMATILALLIGAVGAGSALGGAGLAILLWLGIAATLGASKHAATNKKLAVFAINTSHELVSLLVMGLILGAWR